jgi:lysophospholipase L1-like esterase
MRRNHVVVRWGLVLGLLVSLASPALAAPERYYVSLGTSLSVGIQPDANGDEALTDEGYADQLHRLLQIKDRRLRLVKLGCPGETTVSMIKGKDEGSKCTYRGGSQLAEAVAFLQAHPRAVSLVTIDMGANDVLPCVGVSDIVACVSAAFTSVGWNLTIILDALQAAAPGVPIVAMNYYNPFVAAWPQDLAFESNVLLNIGFNGVPGFNDLLESIYASRKMPVPVADVARAFHSADFTIVPRIGLPINLVLVCQLTWMCTPLQNIHPNRTGYFVIALAFAAALK